MITLTKKGTYELTETSRDTKMLGLGSARYAWIYDDEIGQMLVASRRQDKSGDHVLATGEYRLYKVTDEPDIADLPHLELEVGPGRWQGYLLLTGLPAGTRKRVRIIPTGELVKKP